MYNKLYKISPTDTAGLRQKKAEDNNKPSKYINKSPCIHKTSF